MNLFFFCRQMMHILEALVQKSSYTYLRLDGSTPMSQRQQTIRKFNNVGIAMISFLY